MFSGEVGERREQDVETLPFDQLTYEEKPHGAIALGTRSRRRGGVPGRVRNDEDPGSGHTQPGECVRGSRPIRETGVGTLEKPSDPRLCDLPRDAWTVLLETSPPRCERP